VRFHDIIHRLIHSVCGKLLELSANLSIYLIYRSTSLLGFVQPSPANLYIAAFVLKLQAVLDVSLANYYSSDNGKLAFCRNPKGGGSTCAKLSRTGFVS